MISVELLCPSKTRFDPSRVVDALRRFFGSLPPDLNVNVAKIHIASKQVDACDKVGGAVRFASCDQEDRSMALALVTAMRVSGMQYVDCPLRLSEDEVSTYWNWFRSRDLDYKLRTLAQTMLSEAGVLDNPMLV